MILSLAAAGAIALLGWWDATTFCVLQPDEIAGDEGSALRQAVRIDFISATALATLGGGLAFHVRTIINRSRRRQIR